MKIEILNNYTNDENTYLIINNNECVVIDPGINEDKIINKAKENNAVIKYILITHSHYDHIEYLEKLREKTKAKLVCSFNASLNIKNPNINLSIYALPQNIVCNDADIVMKDYEECEFIGMYFKCLYTPGHTNCSVCYMVNNTIFSGDTLFLRNVGRCDLPTGDYKTLLKSIKDKLYSLDDETEVYCGHGKKTTIGYEKKFNLYIKG